MSGIGVGDLVVCIEEEAPGYFIWGETLPRINAIYTVRSVDVIRDFKDVVGIRLEEIINLPQSYQDGQQECAFGIWRFRKCRATSIEIFRQIAANSKQGVEA